MDTQQALEKLERQRGITLELRQTTRRSPEFLKWYKDTRIALEYIFGRDSSHVNEFTDISFSLHAFSNNTPDSAFEKAYNTTLRL